MKGNALPWVVGGLVVGGVVFYLYEQQQAAAAKAKAQQAKAEAISKEVAGATSLLALL